MSGQTAEGLKMLFHEQGWGISIERDQTLEKDPFQTIAEFIARTQEIRGTRRILVADGFLETVAAQLNCSLEWGEPDDDGFFTPTFRSKSTFREESEATPI